MGHCLGDSVINRPFPRRDGERGCARGGGGVWQLVVNDPCHYLLSIQTSAPPTCLRGITAEPPPAAGENEHCVICRRDEPLRATLSGLSEVVSDACGFLTFLSQWLGSDLQGHRQDFLLLTKRFRSPRRPPMIDGCHRFWWTLWSSAFKAFAHV